MTNLTAEMARFGVSVHDIQSALGCSESTARNKIYGKTELSISEAFIIRDTFFPGCRMEYLYSKNELLA